MDGPYNDSDKNVAYFKTLGYISKVGFIEAIIPPKSKSNFDSKYHSITGSYPSEGTTGYYVHHSEDVDKWGVEIRLSFKVPKTVPLSDFKFGPGVSTVESPDVNERRVNNNDFCWELLRLGFLLGDGHIEDSIIENIPEKYRGNFKEGITVT